ERREDGTETAERREDRHGLECRVTPPQHPIATPHTHGAQAIGEASGPELDLAEGEDLVIEGCGDRGGGDSSRMREHLADQQHRRSIARPPAPCFSTTIVDSVRMSV